MAKKQIPLKGLKSKPYHVTQFDSHSIYWLEHANPVQGLRFVTPFLGTATPDHSTPMIFNLNSTLFVMSFEDGTEQALGMPTVFDVARVAVREAEVKTLFQAYVVGGQV
jgi:hypothetical protein